MSITLTNNAHTTLAANISSIDTTIEVADASSFPALGASDYFNMTIESTSGTYEIVRVTQISGTTFTVTRGQENTIAVPFNIGARVELRITVQNLEDQISDSAAAYVSDTVYGSGWNGATTTAPSKNTTYDKIESLSTVYQPLDPDLTTLGAGGSGARSFLGLAIGSDVQAYLSNASNIFYKDVGGTVSAQLNLGDDPDKTSINADVPGGLAFNLTRTSTVTALGSNSGNNYLGQIYYDVNPGSAQASGVDHRGLRVEVGSRGTFAVYETIGGSFYNFHHGSGALTTAYGGTNQFFNISTGTVTEAIGSLGAVWHNNASGGKIINAWGNYGVAASYRNTTEGMTLAVGAHGEASNRGTGSFDTGYGGDFIVDNTAAGLIQDARALNLNIRNTAAGTIDNAYGVRLTTTNTGSSVLTSLYRFFVGSHIGTAPVADNFGIYMQDTAPNYMAGQLRIGSGAVNDADASVTIAQQSNTYATRFLRIDDGATGPVVNLFHDSASPAAADGVGFIQFAGRDSAGNGQIYANLAVEIVDPTLGSEAGKMRFSCFTAGASAIQGYFQDGFVVGSPTGANKGLGTINAVAVYDDNVLLTCYIRDLLPGDEMADEALLEKWDARVPNLKVPAEIEYEMEEYDAVERQLVQVEAEPVQARRPDGKPLTEDGKPVMCQRWRDEYQDVPIKKQRKKLDAKTGEPVVKIIAEAREEVRRHDPLRQFLKKVGTEYDPRFLTSFHKHWIDKRHLTALPNEEKFDIEKGLPVGAWQQRSIELFELMHGHDWELREENEALKMRCDALEARLVKLEKRT